MPDEVDDVFMLVRSGKMTPDEAEAWASGRNLPPFAASPDVARFDPMTEPDWTLAWPPHGSFGARPKKFANTGTHIYWSGEFWKPLEAIYPDGRSERGWDLCKRKPVSLHDVMFKAARADPDNPLTRFHADIDKLWGEFRSGRIEVTGIPHVRRSGPGPVPSRVSIIPREWGDLSKIDHHEGDKDSIATAADTEPRYIKVRVPGDMVIAFWPEHQGPSLDDVLCDAANQAGGTLTQAKAEKIARGAEVYSSRNSARCAEAPEIQGKQGRTKIRHDPA